MNWNELERKLYMSDDPELRKLHQVLARIISREIEVAYGRGCADGFDDGFLEGLNNE